MLTGYGKVSNEAGSWIGRSRKRHGNVYRSSTCLGLNGGMKISRRAFAWGIAGTGGLVGAPLVRRAFAAPGFSSAWSKDMHSAARLISGSAEPGAAARLAGIEITLDKAFKTYWRTPGDAGVPPVFNFDGSRGLSAFAVSYPAPVAFSDGGGTSFGYRERVIFPVRFNTDPAEKTPRLSCAMDYAVCEKICIPAKAQIVLDLPPAGTSSPLDAEMQSALAKVPVKTRPGEASQGLAVTGVRWSNADEKQFRVAVAAPPSANALGLFVDSEANWLFESKDFAGHPGGGEFRVEIVERPKGIAPVAPAVFITFAAGDAAIECTIKLDDIARA